MTQQRILKNYQINPYLDKYPLHITLYLTNYNEKKIPLIINQIKLLSQKTKPIPISSTEFIANKSGYIMLAVADNKKIQKLSNEVVSLLAKWRDTKATIPQWAVSDKKRHVLFNQYGSPNVFNYFKPHFSVLDIEQLTQKQRADFYQTVQLIIEQFIHHHKIQVEATAYAIEIGLANPQGQIVKALAEFPMKL